MDVSTSLLFEAMITKVRMDGQTVFPIPSVGSTTRRQKEDSLLGALIDSEMLNKVRLSQKLQQTLSNLKTKHHNNNNREMVDNWQKSTNIINMLLFVVE